ncbi:MAG TPA: type II secretion system F family protein [Bryobacteraceae bacterium]|nr:type II secretion system F family protein [Bryobacteraceae bacterium]
MAATIAVLFFITTFLAAATAVLIAAFIQSRLRARRDAQPDISLVMNDEDGAESVLLRAPEHSSISILQVLLEKLNVIQHLRGLLDDAGLRWSVGRVAAMMLLLGTIGAAMVMDVRWLPTGSSLAAFAGGAYLPYLYLSRRRQQRMDQFEAQFPDALESLARAMRAGHPLQGAIEALAVDMPAPLGPEFRRIRDERRLGMPWKTTLEKFSERVPILEVRLFVAAALISTRSGGRFTEVLENLAETIREGVSLRGEVRAVSAHGRMTGGVLTILPFGIAVMLYLTSPGYLMTLVDHPFGPTLIGAAIVFVIAGHFVIQRIVRIRV